MSPELDTSTWSGEGTFTQQLVDWFTTQAEVALVKVEDARSSRSDVEYNFISNEIFLRFLTRDRIERRRLWGFLPVNRKVVDKVMSIERLERVLAAEMEIGPADYADESMLQFLRTERIVPPYQTKGYKLVELVRIYEVGTPRRE